MDSRLQEQLRAARAEGEPGAWLAAGRSLLRSGEGEAAGEAVAALASDRDRMRELLRSLEPASLESFELSVVGERFARERVRDVAWSCDGSRLYLLCGRRGSELVELDPATGRGAILRRFPGRGRAVACDGAGRLAVCHLDASEEHTELSLREPEGEWRPLKVPRSAWFSELSLLLSGGELCGRNKKAVRAYPLAGGRARWSVRGEALACGLAGVAALEGEELLLYDPGEKTPRARAPLDELCPSRIKLSRAADPQLMASAEGAAILYPVVPRGRTPQRITLHGHDLIVPPQPIWHVAWVDDRCDLLGRRALPEVELYDQALSPTGRYLLLLERSPDERTLRSREAHLVDLETGDSRALELPALPGRPAWSLSGRSLAIGSDEGSVLLIRAGEQGAGGATPGGAQGEGWRELRSAERFWRIRQREQRLELHYGLLGTQGTRREVELESSEAAGRELERRISATARKGYEAI